ncbi:hypothetical protein GCM10028868_08660 [Virgibacillus kimchii]
MKLKFRPLINVVSFIVIFLILFRIVNYIADLFFYDRALSFFIGLISLILAFVISFILSRIVTDWLEDLAKRD